MPTAYVTISCTEFQSNRIINVESKGADSFTPLNTVYISDGANFHETQNLSIFVDISYIEFLTNRKKNVENMSKISFTPCC